MHVCYQVCDWTACLTHAANSSSTWSPSASGSISKSWKRKQESINNNMYALLYWNTCKTLDSHEPVSKVVSLNSAQWGVLNTTLCDKVCQWFEAGLWFSSGTPVSSTSLNFRLITLELYGPDSVHINDGSAYHNTSCQIKFSSLVLTKKI